VRRESSAGAALARRLYDEHLAAAVAVPHAAALLGWGSDVLGYDDERSQDHGFGPRLQIFVDAADVPAVADAVERALPDEVDGHPTRFGWDDVPVAHRAYVTTLAEWLELRLGFDATAGVSTLDWLLTPQQRLLEATAGAVFADDGRLTAVRDALAWYPDDLWYWILAAQWRRIAQEGRSRAVRPSAATSSAPGSSRLGSSATLPGSASCSSAATRRTRSGSAPRSRSSTPPPRSGRRSRRCSPRPHGASARTRSSPPTRRSRAARPR
jgi:hypothetical protein